MANRAFAVQIGFGGEDQAFFDDWQGETVRILQLVITQIQTGALLPGETMTLRDINGNTIGEASISRGDRTDYHNYPARS